MKSRALHEPTSWLFYAAIHGMWRELWDHYGITQAGDQAPSQSDTDAYIDQCQHQSWYFLPWHRGYLLALEAVLREEIKLQGGPHDHWALPYWNYFETGQNILPAAFATPSWPDGPDDNPLFVEQRWGPMGGTSPFDITTVTNLSSMTNPEFTGPGGGGDPGFGGPETGFNWSGGVSGGAENNPHNFVQGLVGGGSPTQTFSNGRPLPGLMSAPRTAALDPIFYIHHCNIDRLWESWNKHPPGKPAPDPEDWKNPDLAKWLEGPAHNGGREFAMPSPDGTKWIYVPGDMQDIEALGYVYDSLEPGAEPVGPTPLTERVVRLDLPAVQERVDGTTSMPRQRNVEIIGASATGLAISGGERLSSSVDTDLNARNRLAESLSGASDTPKLPDRVFLNLENVTGLYDSAILRVYFGLAEGKGPDDQPERLAGSISLFGVADASDSAGDHAGNGVSFSLEVTDIIDDLHFDEGVDLDKVSVDLVPFEPVPEAADIKIGRISLYRQFE
jgi:tyrosinase